MSRSVTSRSELLTLLCEACELEHGIACSYLYAGFSLKQELQEGGLTWEQLQQVRKWAAQVYFVASQEMLHLAQVWNLLTAIGGTPYYLRPNFPQSSRYYPLKLPLELERFGRHSLRRFILYETPQQIAPERNLPQLLSFDGVDAQDISFSSVGELYRLILSGFETIPEKELFVGCREQQVSSDLINFPTLIPVLDRETARQAIEEITEQGEGTATDRTDSHYGAFVTMLNEIQADWEAGGVFEPARPAIKNPAARLQGDYGAPAEILTEPSSIAVASLFDAIYSLMLRMLSYVFSQKGRSEDTILRAFSDNAIALMTQILQPLGEGLMQMPAGHQYPGLTAGPGFGLTRHVQLPADSPAALKLACERLAELATWSDDIILTYSVPRFVKLAGERLRCLSQGF